MLFKKSRNSFTASGKQPSTFRGPHRYWISIVFLCLVIANTHITWLHHDCPANDLLMAIGIHSYSFLVMIIHDHPWLSLIVHYYRFPSTIIIRCYQLISVDIQCCPSLSSVVRSCPLLSNIVHYCPLLAISIITHCHP